MSRFVVRFIRVPATIVGALNNNNNNYYSNNRLCQPIRRPYVT